MIVYFCMVASAALMILVLAFRLIYLDDRARELMRSRAAREGQEEVTEYRDFKIGILQQWKGMVKRVRVTAMGDNILELETVSEGDDSV